MVSNMYKGKYRRTHFQTGTEEIIEKEFLSHADMLRHIDEWNRQDDLAQKAGAPHSWIYSEVLENPKFNPNF